MMNNQKYMYGSSAENIVEPYHNKVVRKKVVKKHIRKKKVDICKSRTNFIYTSMLAVVIVITLATLVTLIKVQFIVSDQSGDIIKLQHDLAKIKRENLKIESDIERNIDMNEVYDMATNKLGMIQPNVDNIRYISTDITPYTVQYSSISGDENDKGLDVGDFLGFISEGW